MTDLRSGLCHGPTCQAKITEASDSDDFCSQACQARWQAEHVGTEPDPSLVGDWLNATVSIQQPDGRWETSSAGDPASGWVQLDDSDYPDWEWVEIGCQCQTSRMPPCLWCEQGGPSPCPGCGSPVGEGVLLCAPCNEAERHAKLIEVGEAATQSPIQSIQDHPRRSLWSWIWTRR